MASDYYPPRPELDACNALIEQYFLQGAYEPCFRGHLRLAESGYPLAECQVGYFYHEGLGVERDLRQAYLWTERAALHGDRDAQYNLATWFYLPGVCVPPSFSQAREWLIRSARQGCVHALEKCAELEIPWTPSPSCPQEETRP